MDARGVQPHLDFKYLRDGLIWTLGHRSQSHHGMHLAVICNMLNISREHQVEGVLSRLPSTMVAFPLPTMGSMRTLPSTLYGPVSVIFGDIISNVMGLARSMVKALKWNFAIAATLIAIYLPTYETRFTCASARPKRLASVKVRSTLTGLFGFFPRANFLMCNGSNCTRPNCLMPVLAWFLST